MRGCATFYLALLMGCAIVPASAADQLPGLSFSHGDWELVCDNTGTCRAAGYQADDHDADAVTVLLTRAAGPSTPVLADLKLGTMGEENETLPEKLTLTMLVNGRSQGPVQYQAPTRLNAAQRDAMLAALAGSGKVEWRYKDRSWQLSGKGATAVLLKMDDYQRRIGTGPALVRKGVRPQDQVLPPSPARLIAAAAIAPARPADALFVKKHAAALRQAVRNTKDEAAIGCLEFRPHDQGDNPLTVVRLSATHMLLSMDCWIAAYNAGIGYWVIEDTAPFRPVMVTIAAETYEDGLITAMQKGRGIADCIWSAEWVWDGKRFIQSRESSSGACKGIEAGGAWDLPRVVSKVTRVAN